MIKFLTDFTLIHEMWSCSIYNRALQCFALAALSMMVSYYYKTALNSASFKHCRRFSKVILPPGVQESEKLRVR